MVIVELTDAAAFDEAFPLMQQLRTHLTRDSYHALLAQMLPKGYQLIGVRDGAGTLVALAGVIEDVNLYNGRHLFVYDLVTAHDQRSRGYGEALMNALYEKARAHGHERVVLSSGMARTDAHRFYQQRAGMRITGYTFVKDLEQDAP